MGMWNEFVKYLKTVPSGAKQLSTISASDILGNPNDPAEDSPIYREKYGNGEPMPDPPSYVYSPGYEEKYGQFRW